MRHDVQWHTASPLWDLSLADAGAAPRRFRQPALLRFAGDGFIEALTAQLEDVPEGLADYVCAAERWDRPAAGWVAEDELPADALKLFQPAQDRFYLVAASLVCRQPGLPDRAVDRAAEEVTSFVVRRVEPAVEGAGLDATDPASWRELAWVGDRQAGAWVEVAEAAAVVAGEERHKLFPLSFRQDGRPRRLHAGLLPVAGREVYELGPVAGAPQGEDDPPPASDPLADPLLAEAASRVFDALEELSADAVDLLAAADARRALLFLLLDMAELLQRDLPDVWDGLEGAVPPLTAQEATVRTLLTTLQVDGAAGSDSWAALLVDAEDHRAEVFAGDLELAPGLAALGLTAAQIGNEAGALSAAGLATAWEGALAEQPEPDPEETEDTGDPAAAIPAGGPQDGATYVARMVYERPRCGAVHLPVVSEPTAPFRLAPFFDPDAPVRASRVRLPVDTSIQGLRRFPKSVTFLISEELRKQVDKIEGLSVSEVEDGELNSSASSGFGVIWVMSIPIITICALILLMIIVQLLNIVFWWLPFFRIAIPIRLGGNE